MKIKSVWQDLKNVHKHENERVSENKTWAIKEVRTEN